MKQLTLKLTIVALLVAGLSACSGWSLRGMRKGEVDIDSVFLRAGDAQRMQRALRVELANSGVAIRKKQSDAEAVIDLTDESFDRRVLSVDPDTGKVREVELSLEVRFSIRAKDGRLLVPPEKLSWVQDFVFDENSLLGTNERAHIIERELADDAAQSIRLRLETTDFASR